MNNWRSNITTSQIRKVETLFNFADEILSVDKIASNIKKHSQSDKYGRLVIVYKFKGEINRSEVSAQHTGEHSRRLW